MNNRQSENRLYGIFINAEKNLKAWSMMTEAKRNNQIL
jgi:hypothetical protein